MISIRSLCFVVATCLSLPAWATESAPATAAPVATPAPAASAATTSQPAKPADAATTKGKSDAIERVPAGYKVKVIDGETRYCRKSTPIGTRFPTEVCMTESQYVEAMRNQDSMRQELTGKQKSYSINR